MFNPFSILTSLASWLFHSVDLLSSPTLQYIILLSSMIAPDYSPLHDTEHSREIIFTYTYPFFLKLNHIWKLASLFFTAWLACSSRFSTPSSLHLSNLHNYPVRTLHLCRIRLHFGHFITFDRCSILIQKLTHLSWDISWSSTGCSPLVVK